MSETEPELGLGTVVQAEGRRVQIFFPGSGETRQYAVDGAAIRRVAFHVGETVACADGTRLQIEQVAEEEGLLVYRGGGRTLPETELSDTIRFVHPEERLLGGHADESRTFDLRFETWQHLERIRRSPARGFAGARIDLIGHQLCVAASTAARPRPRVLLSDEVGLGKTIEAGLVLHRLLLQGRVRRALVLCPEALVHQWFVELMRRFNLLFAIFDEERCGALEAADPNANPFMDDALVLAALNGFDADAKRAAQLARAEWDMVIVDEAHHLHWHRGKSDPAYRLVEALAANTPGLLLLTATPEQFGEESHFGRLRLLDPDRYPDFDAFLAEAARYHEVARAANALADGKTLSAEALRILREFLADHPALQHIKPRKLFAPEVRDALLADLLDRHGPGRVLFRNTRAAMPNLPERHPHPLPLQSTEGAAAILAVEQRMWLGAEKPPDSEWKRLDYATDARVLWLAERLATHPEQKLLVICHARGQVEAVAEGVRKLLQVKMALFHEDLPLLQRDRQAAWFAEPDGACILLCSEIGGEGRNFQFAHGIVLFDLPLNPELLEQRIGRLDRIGRNEPVHVYIPYLRGSWQERLFRWYDEGLDAFSGVIADANELAERFGSDLVDICRESRKSAEQRLGALIDQTRSEHERLLDGYREGRDRLLELHSYQVGAAETLTTEIRAWDADAGFREHALALFDHLGVEVAELDETRLQLQPGHLVSDLYADLPDEGLTVTLSRTEALAREDLGFLTWDHPLLVGGIDLLLRSEQGNSCMALFDGPIDARLMAEAVFVLEPVAPPDLETDRFLPPTAIRVLVDETGRDLSEAIPLVAWRTRLRDARGLRLLDRRELWRDALEAMLAQAEQHGEVEAERRRAEALARAREEMGREIARLKHLAGRNDHVQPEEVAQLQRHAVRLAEHIADASLRLDAVRLVLKAP